MPPAPESLFHHEGIEGVFLNELDASLARRAAQALGCMLQAALSSTTHEAPTVVIANDGRPLAAELIAGVSAGLRLAGCRVADIGGVTAGAVRLAVDKLQAAGALLVGNPRGAAFCAGLKFWGLGGVPLSLDGGLDELRRYFEQGFDRPARIQGRLSRVSIDKDYLATFRESFHALRPLRIVVDTACGPLLENLQTLLANLACVLSPGQQPGVAAVLDPDGMKRRIRTLQAHLGLWIDGDGETCQVFSERGDPISGEDLVWILARELLRWEPGAKVVLEQGTSSLVARRIAQAGAQVFTAGGSREAMDRALREHGASLGGGSSGRIWTSSKLPSADALAVVAQLLVLLSRSDLPLSDVLA